MMSISETEDAYLCKLSESEELLNKEMITMELKVIVKMVGQDTVNQLQVEISSKVVETVQQLLDCAHGKQGYLLYNEWR